MVAGTGGGSAPSLHVLASLTSIATCLFVVAHLSPQLQGLVGRLPQRREPPSHDPVLNEPSPVDVAAAAVAATVGYSLEECLEAAQEGRWRRVTNPK